MFIALTSVIALSATNISWQEVLIPNPDQKFVNGDLFSARLSHLNFADRNQLSERSLNLNVPLWQQSQSSLSLQLAQQRQQLNWQRSGYELSLQQHMDLPVLNWDSPLLDLRISNLERQLEFKWQGLHAGYQYVTSPFHAQIENETLEINADIQWQFARERISFGWHGEQLKYPVNLSASFNKQEKATKFSALHLSVELSKFEVMMGYQQEQFESQTHWRIDEKAEGFSQLAISYQDAFIGLIRKNARLSFLHREIKANNFNQLDVNNSIATSFGKGRYLYIGSGTYKQQSLLGNYQWPISERWQITVPISLSYFSEIDAQIDSYEPILFFGLPRKTKEGKLNLQSAGLASVGVKLATSKQNWNWSTAVNQLVPFAVEPIETQEASESSGSATHKKTGLFWPGLSVSLELTLSLD